jgi:hypothetical protein
MRYPSLLDTLMQEDGSNTGDAGCIVTVSILPISIRPTFSHVVFYPDSTMVDGEEYVETILTEQDYRYSVCITSSTMPEGKRKELTAKWVRSEKYTLYSIVIEVVTFTGLTQLKGGIGVQRLILSQTTLMPNFWKRGFTMTMEVALSDGSIQSLINV